MNFFQPQMRLVHKTRRGAKVTKRYDLARTPYQRLLASHEVAPEVKAELTRTYLGLNPAELKRRLTACQGKLLELHRTKTDRGKEVSNPPDHPFKETFSWRERSRTSLVRQPVDAQRTS